MITISALQACPWVWDGDPALDKSSPSYNREAFDRTGDLAHLPCKDGMSATVFRIKRLTRKQFFRVIGLKVHDQVPEAVAYGLQSIDQPGPFEVTHAKTEIGDRLSEQSLDALYDLGPAVMIAMGNFIIGMGRPDPT